MTNLYKDYNILVRKLERAIDKQKQLEKNAASVYYQRLPGILRIQYEEFVRRIL